LRCRSICSSTRAARDITFSDKEVSGLIYLRSAWPVLHALAAAVNDPAQPAARPQSAPKLEAAAKTYDGEMGSEQASRELVKTLAAVGWPSQPVLAGDKADAAITAAARADQQDRRRLQPHPRSRSRQLLRDGHHAAAAARGVDQARVLMTMAAADARAEEPERRREGAGADPRRPVLPPRSTASRPRSTPPTRATPTARPSRRCAAQAGVFAKAAADYLAAINAAAVVLRGDDRARLDLANLKRLSDAVLEASNTFWGTSANELERPAHRAHRRLQGQAVERARRDARGDAARAAVRLVAVALDHPGDPLARRRHRRD
jgi:hypothetical protein